MKDDLTPIAEVRAEMSRQITALESIAADRPPYGGEITLALRRLQEALMWLGVAATMAQGNNPWNGK